ncbi:MAG: DNA alkylation repair protein [Gemmatimonadaceae bacterium]
MTTRGPATSTDVATAELVEEALHWLEARGTRKNRDGMARYGIVASKVFGVSMATMQTLAKKLGRDHELAVALWDTGWYEARILTAFVAEPEHLTSSQMDRWAKDFDNWAVCDTLCFKLLDRSPHAWIKVEKWSRRRDEFVKRAAFALAASLALHDKKAPDEPFLAALGIIEREAGDDRNFVKKGVSWALRSIGHRNRTLHDAAIDLATRLSRSSVPSERRVGKDAIRDLSRPLVKERVDRKTGKRK